MEVGSWSHLLTTMRNLVPTLTEVGGVRRGSADPGFGDPAGPNPHVRRGIGTPFGGRDGAGRQAGRCRLRAERAAGSALDLAASGRAAITAIRGLLDSLQPVEAEEVVLDR